MRRFALPALTLVTLTSLACFGSGGPDGDPAVNAEIEQLDGTALVADDIPVLAPIQLSESGRPEVDLGSGVQVYQVSPVGTDRRALQAAVVFDRAMVPMTGLADMNASVPVSCSPDAGLIGRWAGTSTAVVTPESGAFPLATEYTCSVPAGTKAIDDVALEKDLVWTFETARPAISTVTPYSGAERWDPSVPLQISFDQPVKLASVRDHVRVAAGPNAVNVRIEEDGERENGFLVHAELAKDTSYSLVISKGVVATAGPLPSVTERTITFKTYPTAHRQC